jgi:hypothetical protein
MRQTPRLKGPVKAENGRMAAALSRPALAEIGCTCNL